MIRKFLLLLCLAVFQPLLAQTTGGIKGTILDSSRTPLYGASIELEGTQEGAESNFNGKFVISDIRPGEYLLKISYVGFRDTEIPVKVRPGTLTTVPPIILLAKQEELGEIVLEANGNPNEFTRTASEYVAKLPLKNIENPQVYTSISGELLESQQAYTVAEALTNAPGVHKLWGAVGKAGQGGAYYTLRGFSTQANLRNGLAGNVTTAIDVANLERIEVLKGPSATLYGSSLPSFGGLINRVTKKPFQGTAGELSFSAGEYDFFRVAADYNTVLNEDNSLMFRVNTAYTSKGSFQDNGFSKSFAFAPSVKFLASDRLTLTLDAEIFKVKANDFQGIYLYDTPNNLGIHSPADTKLDYYSSYRGNDLVTESDVANIFAQAEYVFNENWLSQTNISYTNSRSNGPGPFFYLVSNAMVTGDETATGSDYLMRDVWVPVGSDRSFEIQQNFTGEFNIGEMNNKLTIGLDYYHYDSDISYFYYMGEYNGFSAAYLFDILPLEGPAPNYGYFNSYGVSREFAENPNYTFSAVSKTNTYSAFAVDVLEITDQLSAMLSARIDHFENKGIYNPSTDMTSEGYDQTVFSPKLGLVYQIIEDEVSFFGNYQNGFQNVAPVTQQDGTISNFEPKQANQWEAGFKFNLLNDRLAAYVSYYDIAVKNNTRQEIRQVEIEGELTNIPYTVQDGTQSSKGFEAEVIANLYPGLNLTLGYAYNDSEWEKSNEDVEGLRPINSGPETTANLWLDYRFPEGDLEGFGIGAGGNYASELLIANTRSGGQFALPERTLFDASLFYDQPAWRVGLSIKNLTDKEYYTGFSTINPQMPRQIVGNLVFKF